MFPSLAYIGRRACTALAAFFLSKLQSTAELLCPNGYYLIISSLPCLYMSVSHSLVFRQDMISVLMSLSVFYVYVPVLAYLYIGTIG